MLEKYKSMVYFYWLPFFIQVHLRDAVKLLISNIFNPPFKKSWVTICLFTLLQLDFHINWKIFRHNDQQNSQKCNIKILGWCEQRQEILKENFCKILINVNRADILAIHRVPGNRWWTPSCDCANDQLGSEGTHYKTPKLDEGAFSDAGPHHATKRQINAEPQRLPICPVRMVL